MTNENGKIVQVMGPVVDVEFPPGSLPELYAALRDHARARYQYVRAVLADSSRSSSSAAERSVFSSRLQARLLPVIARARSTRSAGAARWRSGCRMGVGMRPS